MVKNRVRVLLVDDHPIVIEGLTAVLSQESDLDIVGSARDGNEALYAVGHRHPDVVLLDLQIPPPCGADLIRQMLEGSSTSRVVILTTYDDDEHLIDAIAAGASGYLLKGLPVGELTSAIRRVAAGETLLTAALTAKLFAHVSSQANSGPEPLSSDGHGITLREHQVLLLLVTGATNREMADALFISTRTVKAHLASIFEKLGVHDRTAAATAAVKLGLVDLADL